MLWQGHCVGAKMEADSPSSYIGSRTLSTPSKVMGIAPSSPYYTMPMAFRRHSGISGSCSGGTVKSE